MSERELPTGFGVPLRLGETPALVVVDLSLGFTDPASPLACDIRTALPAAIDVLDAARAARVPVAFSTIAFRGDLSDGGPWLAKLPAMQVLVEGSRWVRIDPRLATEPDDLLVTKQGASAFHRTELASWLLSRDIDSVILVGASTSGCVRATAVDAVQEGWPTFVVSDCVADRDRIAHESALYDLQAKYTDVLVLDDVLRYLAGLPRKAR